MGKDPRSFAPVFLHDWENARRIKSGRFWFMNIFSVISGRALSLLQTIRSGALPQLSPFCFMRLFLLIALLINLRFEASVWGNFRR